MNKLTTFFVALICASSIFAANYRCEINGIYYNLNTKEKTAEVTNETGDRRAKSYTGSVVIPETVTYNGITYSVTTIGENAFYECDGLKAVTIPTSVTTIGDHAFDGCYGLKSVTIPNSVTTIGEGAFEYCHDLESVKIPTSVTTIEDYAFSECDGLKSVSIPNSVTTIGNWAFDGCYDLKSVKIPNSVTAIGDHAFRGCFGLKSVTIPNSVTTIGKEAFFSGDSLTSINVDAANTHYCSIDGVLFSYAIDTLIQYPNGNTQTEYTIPNSVTTIGERAFEYCYDLESVKIPTSVTTIGDNAFRRCNGLKSIICYATIPPKCGVDVFSYIKRDAKVYVPASAVKDYQNAEGWKNLQILPITEEVENSH